MSVADILTITAMVEKAATDIRTIKAMVEKAVADIRTKNAVEKAASVKPTKTNGDIAYALLKLSNDYDDDDYCRIMAYRNGAEAISNLNFQVTQGSELAKGPKKVAGIGKGIARLIDEFLNTGTMTKTIDLPTASNSRSEVVVKSKGRKKKDNAAKQTVTTSHMTSIANSHMTMDYDTDTETDTDTKCSRKAKAKARAKAVSSARRAAASAWRRQQSEGNRG
tara:strand:+ start:214 stop:879 length:666 start_codon:yes stop_codon:yes gene_type:complete